jgi:hypothetical protein
MLSKRGCRKRYGSSQSRTHMHMYLLPAASSKNSPERPARGIQIEVQELPFSGQNWFQMRRRGMHDGEGGHMHQLAAGGESNPFACGGVSRNAKAAWEGWKQSMHVPCFSTSRTSPSSSSGASMPETAIVLPPPATCYIRGFEDWLIKRQQTRTLYIVLWRCIVCGRATW